MREGERLGVIIQARMGSTRLPGKVLKKIGDRTLLGHIYSRLTSLAHPAEVVLATSSSRVDDVLEAFCREMDVPCFRGSECDVLERYYQCARQRGFFDIIRLTADNPFTDIEELDNLIALHHRTGSDYTSSLACLPVGVGAEMFTFAALEKSHREGTEPHHREHVDEYILEHPDLFKCTVLKMAPCKDRHDIRLTIDTDEDYAMACRIVDGANGVLMTTQELIGIAERLSGGKGS